MIFKIICILGFIILAIYVIYVTYKDKELPISISATVYSLDLKNKWLFTSMMAIVGLLIAPQLFEMMRLIGCEFLAFLTVAGIFGVAGHPLISGEKNIMHYIFAMIIGISSQLIVFLINPWIMTSWIPYVIYTMYMENGKWNMLFSEIIMMIALLISCLI